MKSIDDSADESQSADNIKISDTIDNQQKLINELGLDALIAKGQAAGLGFTFTRSESGTLTVEIDGEWTPEESEKLARSLTVKLHDPAKPSPKILLNDVSPVDWLDSERERRDKSQKSRTESSPTKTR
jgi:hypothetical protein